MTEAILTNAKIVLADEVIVGSLELSGGEISDIGIGPTKAGEDQERDYLIPGLIDLHTDNLELHYQPRQGVYWDPISAVMAHDAQVIGSGITTVFDSLSIGTVQEQRRADKIEPLCDAMLACQTNGMVKADHRLHLRCEVTNRHIVSMLEHFLGHELLTFISLMDHAPGDRQSPDIERWRRFNLKNFNFDEAALDQHQQALVEASKTLAPALRHQLSEIARQAGIPLASHDDATTAHIEEAVGLAAVLTEFPTTLEAAEAARRHRLDILMGSPNLIRGKSHSGNIAARDLAASDHLDILSSDYIPASLLPAAFKLTEPPFNWTLNKAIHTVTKSPAAAAKLDDRGEIKLGKRADLVRIRMIDGRPVIRSVWRRGERVA